MSDRHSIRTFPRHLANTWVILCCLSLGATACGTRGPTSGGAGNNGGQSGGEGGSTNDTSSGGGGADTSSSADSSSTDSAAPPIEANVCQEQCAADSDCLDGFTCAAERCVASAASGCQEDADCVAILSGWTVECASSDECTTGPCLAPGDEPADAGLCAVQPTEFFACADMQFEEVERTTVEGDMATVCARTNGRCADAGYCFIPCTPNSCLDGPPETPICNQDSGMCECDESSCENNSSICVDGQCRCASDADCTNGPVDTCYDGVCGCATAVSCEDGFATSHPSTIVVCEPIP